MVGPASEPAPRPGGEGASFVITNIISYFRQQAVLQFYYLASIPALQFRGSIVFAGSMEPASGTSVLKRTLGSLRELIGLSKQTKKGFVYSDTLGIII